MFCFGVAWHGVARCGEVRSGKAWHGRLGLLRKGKACSVSVCQGWLGKVGRGMTRLGESGFGFGWDRQGMVR